MYTVGSTPASLGPRFLAVRLGSMGDIVHTLPAVATLKHSFPNCHLSWAVDPKWAVLLRGNPFVDDLVLIERRSMAGILAAWRQLRTRRFDWAVDFQGLLKSALVASVARPDRIYGFHQSQVRERAAALFYSNRVRSPSAHIVDRYLDLAAATGASTILRAFPLPEGTPDGELPPGDFVLANPLAGWPAKQWPLENYGMLGRRLRDELGVPLVLNGPPQAEATLAHVAGTMCHISGVSGLIYATRRALAVAGIDSGPVHLAAALGKPGVAVFGPTDPARNGPYGKTFTVLRSPRAVTSYKRRQEIDVSMREISPDMLFEALRVRISCRSHSAGCSA